MGSSTPCSTAQSEHKVAFCTSPPTIRVKCTFPGLSLHNWHTIEILKEGAGLQVIKNDDHFFGDYSHPNPQGKGFGRENQKHLSIRGIKAKGPILRPQASTAADVREPCSGNFAFRAAFFTVKNPSAFVAGQLAGGGFGCDSGLGDGTCLNRLGANMMKAMKENVLYGSGPRWGNLLYINVNNVSPNRNGSQLRTHGIGIPANRQKPYPAGMIPTAMAHEGNPNSPHRPKPRETRRVTKAAFPTRVPIS
jgi:hypothetical protein